MSEKKDDEIEILTNFEQKNHKLKIKLDTTIGDLKQQVFTNFQIDTMTYCLIYKSEKLSLEDGRSIKILFEDDPKPLLFIVKKSTITSVPIASNTAKIHTKVSSEQFLFSLNEFFKERNINFNAQILYQNKGLYEIRFPNSNLSRDFVKFFNQRYKRPDPYSYKKKSKIYTSNSASNINISQNMNPSNLNKNIKMRQNRNSRNNYLNKNQSFAYVHPYIDRYRNSEEKYQHEKYLDKANWLSKKGFVSSVGHYSSKPNFINNYVAMTPSLPPLLHKYRIVDKDKWITKKGFC